jgi:hypothetical protein
MRHGTAILLVVSAIAGCATNDASDITPSKHRYVNKVDGYSVDQPDGWSQDMERGAARFLPSPSSKQTIIVRSAPRVAEIKDRRVTNEDLVDATAQVLRGLPRAQLKSSMKVGGAKLPGVRFALTFVPFGRQTTYRREHVLLLGERR